MKLNSLLFFCVIFSTIFALIGSVPVIQTKNQKLFVDGTEYIIKGVAYSPTPLGLQSNPPGGFCSPKQNELGQFITPCQNEDFFDGASVTSAQLDGATPPANGWFQPLWQRDIPLMKELGINTVRFYHTNPITQAAVTSSGGKYKYGTSHTQFLDLCYQNGLMVIYPLSGGSATDYQQILQYQIDEVGNHPAILMFGFGNELPVYGDGGTLVASLNQQMAYIRQYQQQKFNRTIPITNCVVDYPASYNTLVETFDVDVFCTNAGYRGYGFSDLWTGSAVTNFSGMWSLGCANQKPIMIGEMGWMSVDNQITEEVPDWFNQQLGALVASIQYGCIGGFYFEFNDEPSKADPGQQTMGLVSYSTNTQNGQTSLQQNVWLADNVARKPIFYSAKNGSYNGVAYNFQSNFFTLLGRSPANIGDSSIVCNGAPAPNPEWCTVSYCPGGSNPANPTTTSTTASSTTTAATTASSSTTSTTTSTPSSGCSSCPSGNSCCNKACYNPSTYNCVTDGVTGNKVLCSVGSQSCNGACYNPSQYSCKNGGLQQTSAATTATSTSSTCSTGVCSTTSSTATTTTKSSTTAATTTSTGSTTTSHSVACGTLTCTGGKKCCQDKATGYHCFNPANKKCTKDPYDGKHVLCTVGSKSCKGACYDPQVYTCTNGALKHK